MTYGYDARRPVVADKTERHWENRSVLSGTTWGPTGIFTVPIKMLVDVVKSNVFKSYKLPPTGFGPVTYGLGTSVAVAGGFDASLCVIVS